MTKATVQLKTGEIVEGLTLADAGDIVSAGEGAIVDMIEDVPSAIEDTPSVVGSGKRGKKNQR